MVQKVEPKLIALNDGEYLVIMYPRDFEMLIDKYMGSESAEYYSSQFERLIRVIEGMIPFVSDYYDDTEAEEILEEYGYKK